MGVACHIEFDQNPYGTFFAGQLMTGKVTLQTDKVKQVKGIALKIRGFAQTSWTKQTTYTTIDVKGNVRTLPGSSWYSGHEDYITSTTYLLGSDGDSENIEPGIHTYNFSCQIPDVCPTSFEGSHGHIRYIIKVELQRPLKIPGQSFAKGFTVLKIMDLNYDSPILNEPVNARAYKTFCCSPCKSDPLKISASIPQKGYVPGQIIPVDVLVANESNVKVEEINVSLAMLVTYHSHSPSKETKKERIPVTNLKSEGVLRNCIKNYSYDLLVPATPPTCFDLYRIIQIAYQIEVVAKIKGLHTNQVVCLPVTIGNVPLMKVIQQQPISNAGMQRELLDATTLEKCNGEVQKSVDDQHSGDINAIKVLSTEQIEATAPEMPWSADPTIPPPTYAEAVHMKRANIVEGGTKDSGENSFVPRYPVFKIPSPIAGNTHE